MFQKIIPHISQEKKVLSEIIEYVLDPNNHILKIVETLNINCDNKNVLMALLERGDLYSIKRLFEISHIIFTHPEILMKKDISGLDVFSYFIKYATYDLIDGFIKVFSEYASGEEKKLILSNIDNQGRTHLIMICENKKFENLEETFTSFINFIAASCGLDYLYSYLTIADNNGNNILMAALKNHNQKIALKILNLISKTIIDHEMRIKVEHKLMTQRDVNGKNVLMLLFEMNADKQLQTQIIRIIKEIPANWMCLIKDNSHDHNMVILGIMHNNQDMMDNIFSILSTMDQNGRMIVFSNLCRHFTSNDENYIYLCFKHHRGEVYIKLINEIESILEVKLIVECFRQTFTRHKDILHLAILDNNLEAILSLIKYLRLINNISDDDKQYISELVTRKNHNQSSLLSYAVQHSNYEVCELILSLAQEYCNSIIFKMLIDSRDRDGKTPYVLAKINGKEKITKLLFKFAEQTWNQKLILEQMREFERIKNLQSSHIMTLVTNVLT
jgi:ankyrin repeat protein